MPREVASADTTMGTSRRHDSRTRAASLLGNVCDELCESFNLLVFELDEAGRALSVNETAMKVLELPQQNDVNGLPFVEKLVSKEHTKVVRGMLKQAALTRTPSNQIGLSLCTVQTRSRIEVLFNAWPLEGNRLLCVGQKVTMRVAHEQDATLVHLISTANAPIFGIDCTGRVNLWNQKTEQLTGFGAEYALTKDLVREFLPPESQRSAKNVLIAALMGEETSNFELLLKKSTGESPIQLLLNVTSHRNASGEILGAVCICQDISARKVAEVELALAAEDLLQLIDNANAPIFGINELGQVNEWNKMSATIVGYTKDEVLGRNLVELISPDYRNAVDQILDRALAGVSTSAFEFPLYSKSGKRIEVLLNANPRRDAKGNVVGAIGVGQDITARMAQEQEYIRLIDTANAPIFGIDSVGHVNIWNQRAAKITGFATEYALGRDLVDEFIAPDYRKSVKQVLDNALSGSVTNSFEFPLFSKAGTRIEILLNANPRRDANGHITGVVGVGQDITARIAQEQEYIRFVDTANAPIFGVDSSGKIEIWNQQAAAITGFNAEYTLGRPLVEEFIAENDRSSVKTVLERALAGTPTSAFEFPLFSRAGTRIEVLLNANPRRDANGRVVGVCGIGQDITVRKEAERRITLMADDLAALIDTANAPIFGIDASGKVNEWNRNAAQITGFTKDEVMHRNLVEEFVAPDRRWSVMNVFFMALQGKNTSNFEFHISTKNGKRIVILLNANPRRDAHGNIIGVVGVGQDITRRLAQEEEYIRLIDTANAPIFGIDCELKVNIWNSKSSEITGFTKSEAIGKKIVTEFIRHEHRISVLSVLRKALGGEESSNVELPLFAKTGARVDLLLNATTRRNASGKIIGVVMVAQDITEMLLAQREATRVANDLTQLIETANAPIFGVNRNMMVNEWNRRTAELTGYTKEDAIGQDLLADFIAPEYRQSVLAVLTRALRGEETANYELPLFSKSGAKVVLLLNATTRRDASGAIVGVVGVAQDISDRRVVSRIVSKVTEDLSRMLGDNGNDSTQGTLNAVATGAQRALTQLLKMIGSANNDTSLPFLTIDHSELQLLGKIGRGAHGIVYQALWRGKRVAVKKVAKFVDDTARVSFVRELTVISGLRHPNICLFMGALIVADSSELSLSAHNLFNTDEGLNSSRNIYVEHTTKAGSLVGDAARGNNNHSEIIAIVNEYLQRGSLVSILENEGIKLKWKTKPVITLKFALFLSTFFGEKLHL